jgi:hypothetical protein
VSRRFIALVTSSLFFVPSDARGQDQSTATLKITASSVGAAPALAAIEVRSVHDPGIIRSATAGPVTPVEIRALPPGTYRIVVSREGDAPAHGEVTVAPGEIVWISAILRAAKGPNGSEFRIGDRTHAGEAVVIDEPLLRGLPSSASVWSLIDALVPWALVEGIDGGGSETGRRSLFGVRDASFTWNTFVMDGIDLTDPDRTGNPLQYPDVKALQVVTVTSGLAPAEVQAPGAQVTLVARRPSRTRHGSLEFSGTTEAMVTEREAVVAPYITRLQSFGDGNGQLDLPLGDRVGAFIAGRFTRSGFSERGQPPRRAKVASLFGHVVARPNTNNEIRFLASAQQTVRPLEGGDGFLGRATDETDTFSHAQIRWERVAASGATSSVAFGFQRGAFEPDLDLALPVSGGAVDRVYDGPVPSPVADRTSRRVDLGANLHLPSRQFRQSSHAFRFDVSVTRAKATSEILASPNVAELAAGVPARVWEFVAPSVSADRRLTHVGWSIADDMRIGDHLVLDAGARFDHWRGHAAGAAAGISKFTLSPRLVARSNFPGYHVALYGAIGRYHPRLPLEWLAFGDPGDATARLYRWTDPDGDRLFGAGERGPLLALAGFGAPNGSIDPGLRMPATTEYVFGGEYHLRSAQFRVTGTIRHETALVRAINVGIPLASYTVRFIPDQTDDALDIPVYNRPPNMADQDRYILTNPEEDGFTYHGLELAYEQPITPRFRIRISALAFRTFGPTAAPGFHVRENDQGGVGELFQDPNTLSYAEGRNFFDRAYVLKWSGAYLAPHDVWLSFTANYRDGQPFGGFIVVPDLTQGPEAIQSYRRGRTRFTFTVLLDARVEKRFKLAGEQAALWLDIYNVASMYEEVEENPVPGPGFRQSTALQPPATFRAGFRIEF